MRDLFEKFFDEIIKYATENSHIYAVIVVGSYVRETNNENSDLDIVIITSNKSYMIENQDFTEKFGNVCKRQTEYYGEYTSF